MTTSAAAAGASTGGVHATFGAASPDLEYFDVLTEAGELTGRTKLRRDVHRDGDWHRAVHVWIVRHGTTQILIQKRAASKDSFPSCWDVSCAGHLSAGETSWHAAVAELKEEVGITVSTDPAVSPLRLLTSLQRETISQQGRFVDREWTDVYVCHVSASIEPHDYTLQADEVEAIRYIELSEYLDRLREQAPDFVVFTDLPGYIQSVFEPIQREMTSGAGAVDNAGAKPIAIVERLS